MSKARTAAFCALLLLANLLHSQSSPPAASSAPSSKESPLVLKVTTRLVLIDAIITDKQGKPVTDLKADEVELLENGKPQKISVMSLQRFAGHGAAAAVPPHKLPPNVYSNMPEVLPNDQPPTILLLDALNTEAEDQAFARAQMVRYLKTVAPGQPIAIYVLGKRLWLLQDFTSDPAVLRAALSKTSTTSTPIPTQATDTDSLVAPGTDAPDQALSDFLQDADNFASNLRCSLTMDALESIAHHSSGYLGRKNLVWLSSAFPLSITNSQGLPENQPCTIRIPETANVLTDAQVSVYPVDARGLIPAHSVDATSSGINSAGRQMTPQQFAAKVSKFDADIAASHGTMSRLADDSGGRAFYNANDLNHLIERSVADGSTYYLFGYYPQDKNWDSRFRKVHVKVSRGGVDVRARKGYFAVNPNQPVDVHSKKAMEQFGVALAFHQADWTQLPMDIQVVPGSATGTETGGKSNANQETIVRFAVDGEGLVWSPLPDGGSRGNFSFVVFAYDRKGKLITSAEKTVDAALKAQATKQSRSVLPYEQRVKLPSGTYLLKAAVRDNGNGHIGTVHALITVPQS